MHAKAMCIRKFHACSNFILHDLYKLSTHRLLHWLIAIVQGQLVYLYIDSAACKKYCHGLYIRFKCILWVMRTTISMITESMRSIPQAAMSLFIYSTLTPTQQPYVTSTLCTLLVWPFSRLSVWLFRCFYIASGSHPDHISLLLHHSRHSGWPCLCWYIANESHPNNYHCFCITVASLSHSLSFQILPSKQF